MLFYDHSPTHFIVKICNCHFNVKICNFWSISFDCLATCCWEIIFIIVFGRFWKNHQSHIIYFDHHVTCIIHASMYGFCSLMFHGRCTSNLHIQWKREKHASTECVQIEQLLHNHVAPSNRCWGHCFNSNIKITIYIPQYFLF